MDASGRLTIVNGFDQQLPTFTTGLHTVGTRHIVAEVVASSGGGLPVAVQGVVTANPAAITAVQSTGQVTTTLGTATELEGTNLPFRTLLLENLGAGDVDLGKSTVTFGTGYRLKSGAALNITYPSNCQADLWAIDNNAATATLSFIKLI